MEIEYYNCIHVRLVLAQSMTIYEIGEHFLKKLVHLNMQITFHLEYFVYSTLGCVITEALSQWPLTSDAHVQSQAGPSGICGGQSCIGAGISPSTCFILSVSFHQCSIHIHSSVKDTTKL